MNTLVKLFLRGLLAFLPVFVTLYAIYAAGRWLNDATTAALHWAWPGLFSVIIKLRFLLNNSRPCSDPKRRVRWDRSSRCGTRIGRCKWWAC